jgi:cob(I)alamin adenosyltransferase
VPVTVTVTCPTDNKTASDTVNIQVTRPPVRNYVFEDVYFDFDRYSLRPEATRVLDEAIAALGVARAELGLKAQYGTVPRTLDGLPDLILRLQRELFVVGAELATAPDATDRQKPGETRVTAAMVDGLDAVLAETEAAVELPREFVVPGETRLSAYLELARTIIRRAERRAVALRRAEPVGDDHLLAYLNRLADLLWILARAAEQGESRAATPSRTAGRHSRDAAES